MKQFCALPSELRGDPGRLRGGGALRCFVCWAAVCATAQAGRGSVHLPHCYHYHNGATLLHTENTIIDSCQIIRFRWSPTIHWLLTSYSILSLQGNNQSLPPQLVSVSILKRTALCVNIFTVTTIMPSTDTTVSSGNPCYHQFTSKKNKIYFFLCYLWPCLFGTQSAENPLEEKESGVYFLDWKLWR